MSKVDKQFHQTFESICQQTEKGRNYWFARDLQSILEYSCWDKFKSVIKKAVKACETSGIDALDHFSPMGKMVSGIEQYVKDYDYHLSRYACYLIVQNGDSNNPVIANGQRYFALQARRQELADSQQLDEDKKRVFLRNELKEHNKQLVEAANQAGVESGLDFAIFQNHGYQGLYGGLDAKGIRQKKGLKKNQQILDHMGSTELAANLFRTTQTEEKLRREDIKGKNKANEAHYEVGTKVRQTIDDLGGTMPEELPTPKTSTKTLEKQVKKQHKKQISSGGGDE